MRTVRYSGTLTALSSIAHGGKDTGTLHGFRRETLINPEGKVLQGIPIVSGGVIRGQLRRTAAKLMQHAVTQGEADFRLPFHQVHALRTGGSLTETRTTGEVLNIERQAKLRDLIPMFAVFGVSGGGRIMSGRLQVDKAIPIAAETAWLADTVPAGLASVYSLIQREPYSRVADVMDAEAATWIAPSEDGETLPKGSGQMYWQLETLAAGVKLQHSLTLEDATPVEAAFLADVVKAWSRKGARIGGQGARGHGRVRVDYAETTTDVYGDPAEPEAGDWRAHVALHQEEAREALKWL